MRSKALGILDIALSTFYSVSHLISVFISSFEIRQRETECTENSIILIAMTLCSSEN